MDTRQRRDHHQPLSVVACLSAGLETVGRHLGLIFWPVVLDLWLWLGPRLSIARLLHRVGSFLTSQPMPDPNAAQQIAQAVRLLEETGERFNLFSLLSTLPLFDVPTLLSRRAFFPVTPLGAPAVWNVGNVWAFLGWSMFLIPLGTLLGVWYLGGVARRVQPLAESDGDEIEASVVRAIRQIRVLVFVAVLLVLGMVSFPLWSVMVGAVVAVSPMLGLLTWAVSVWMVGYVFVHLLFVVPAILVGGLPILPAVQESVLLVRFQFPAVAGLILLTMLLYEGLGFIWSLPPGDSWTQLVGILGNGSIATGLTAALFIFYRERQPVVIERLKQLERAGQE